MDVECTCSGQCPCGGCGGRREDVVVPGRRLHLRQLGLVVYFMCAWGGVFGGGLRREWRKCGLGGGPLRTSGHDDSSWGLIKQRGRGAFVCVLGSEEVPMDLSKSVFGFAGLRAEEVRIYEERFIMYSKWSFQFFHHPSSSFIVNNE